MAKLYWRVKRVLTADGKGGYWTWVPAQDEQAKCGQCKVPYMRVAMYQEEE